MLIAGPRDWILMGKGKEFGVECMEEGFGGRKDLLIEKPNVID